MIPKPKHLGPEYAAQFQDRSVVAAYRHRPPYPAEVFAILARLIADQPRVVLDVGCGTGDLARPLIGIADRIEAVDLSPRMIEQGRRLPEGRNRKLNWFCGRAEEVQLRGPYALITAGSSLHWMDWSAVLPRFRHALTPHGCLAIVDQLALPSPWDAALDDVISYFSTNQDYRPYDLTGELTSRGLFAPGGAQRTAPVPFAQPVAGYVESFHSRNGFSRERMTRDAARRFDAAVRRLIAPFVTDGMVRLQVVGQVVWGRPGAPS